VRKVEVGGKRLEAPQAAGGEIGGRSRREVEVKVKVEWEDNSAPRTQDSALWREVEGSGFRSGLKLLAQRNSA
jgi:hypothetical protein